MVRTLTACLLAFVFFACSTGDTPTPNGYVGHGGATTPTPPPDPSTPPSPSSSDTNPPQPPPPPDPPDAGATQDEGGAKPDGAPSSDSGNAASGGCANPLCGDDGQGGCQCNAYDSQNVNILLDCQPGGDCICVYDPNGQGQITSQFPENGACNALASEQRAFVNHCGCR